MIYEITDLPIRRGDGEAFLAAWKKAAEVLARQPGYLGHEIGRQTESADVFTLLIRWQSLRAHTEVFANSPDFQPFLNLFSSFIDGTVRVVHVEPAA